MGKFIRNKYVIIIYIIITKIVIYNNNNLTIEQKIGRNQEYVFGYKKRDITHLQKYAIQEEFEYIENEPGYQFNNFLLNEYNKKRAKIKYYCSGKNGAYIFVYDLKNNSWYTNENYDQDFYFEVYDNQIDTPIKEQEIFDREFKDIHEEIKKGVKNFVKEK